MATRKTSKKTAQVPPVPQVRIGIGGWTFAPVARAVLSGRAHAETRTRIRQPSAHHDRNQRHVLRAQKPASFAKWHDETPDDFVFSLKAPRFATHRRVLAQAGESIERFMASGVLELKNKLGPITGSSRRPSNSMPKTSTAFWRCCPSVSKAARCATQSKCGMTVFAARNSLRLAHKHGVAIVISGDSTYPQIADATAPFVYVRIMGTSDAFEHGYSDDALDLWTERARTWASGGMPEGLETVGNPGLEAEPREVFLYVISGVQGAQSGRRYRDDRAFGAFEKRCVAVHSAAWRRAKTPPVADHTGQLQRIQRARGRSVCAAAGSPD